jgi:hypothetical protein
VAMPPSRRPSISTLKLFQCFVTQLAVYVMQYSKLAFLRPLRIWKTRAVQCTKQGMIRTLAFSRPGLLLQLLTHESCSQERPSMRIAVTVGGGRVLFVC